MRNSKRIDRVRNAAPLLIAAAAAGLVGLASQAFGATDTETWVGTGSDTAWSTATNWSDGNVPNNGNNSISDYDVVIGAVAPTVLSTTDTIDTLTINSTGTLDMQDGSALTVNGPTLVNNGSIVVNSDQGNAVAELNFGGGSTLSGTGTITLQGAGNTAQLDGSLTQSAGHTIQGYGQINATLINNGAVNANVDGQTLTIQGATVTNTSWMAATNGGTLQFDGVAVANTGGTIITAAAVAGGGGGYGAVDVGAGATLANGTSITGGIIVAPAAITLATFNSSAGYSAAFTNVTVGVGEVDIPSSNTLAVQGSTLTNYGNIVVNSDQQAGVAELIFNANTLLGGTGTITLQEPGGSALLTTGSGDTVTQGMSHSITGYGEITASLINNGIVNANVSGQTLTLLTNNMTNNLMFEASNGGALAISGITVNQGFSGEIYAANGGTVTLAGGTTISGGTLASFGTGSIQISGTDTINALTNNATIDIPAGQTLDITGSLADIGSIVVNSNQGEVPAILNFNGGSTLSGSGTIILQVANSNAQLNGSLTQSAGHTIQGYGDINAALTNNGVVNANVYERELTLQTNNMTNNLTFEATNGGVLAIGGITVTQGASGEIYAATNSAVIFAGGTTISGGTLGSSATGTIQISGIDTINALTNNATIEIPSFNFNTNTLDVTGNLADNGSIVVGSGFGSGLAELNFSGGTTLSGTGTIILQQPGQLVGALTQSSGHTIQGYGSINAALTNNGVVNANVNDGTGGTLELANNMVNDGTLEATNGGTLMTRPITITQGAGGMISAGTGSSVILYDSTISGGGIGAGTGAIMVVNSVFKTVTIASGATVTVPSSETLKLSGTTLTNNGSLNVTGSVSGGNLAGSGSVTINSPGSFQLAPNMAQSSQSAITVNGGSMDITNNSLVINYTGSDPIAYYQNLVNNGDDGGSWTGTTSITSSTVAAYDAAHGGFIYAVAVADGGDGSGNTSVASDQLEIVAALAGDCNLDGTVDSTDLQIVLDDWQKTGQDWDEGDFIGTGTVDSTDLSLLLANWQDTASLSVSDLDAIESVAGDSVMANADGIGFQLVSVPEPASLGLLVMAGAGVLTRRRRYSLPASF